MEKVLQIHANGSSVRYIITNDGVLYSACDVVSMCGIRSANAWVKRHKHGENGISLTDIRVSAMTKAGMRTFNMFFCDAETIKIITMVTPCCESVRNWLIQDMRIQCEAEKTSDPVQKSMKTRMEQKLKNGLDDRIDSIIFELLAMKSELKK